MAIMKHFSCFIEESGLVDAYVYGGFIYCIYLDRVEKLPFTNVFNVLSKKEDTVFKRLLELALMKNNWLNNSQGKQFLQIKKVKEEIKNYWNKFFENPFSLKFKDLSSQFMTDLKTEMIYDVRCYGYNLFIGYDNGVYTLPLNVNSSKISKSFDVRTVDITAKLGKIVVSCGTDGLFSGNLDLKDNLFKIEDKQHLNISFRTHWSYFDLFSYSDATNYCYVHNQVGEIKKRNFSYSKGEDDNFLKQIKQFANKVIDKNDFITEDLKKIDSSFLYAYNSNNKLFNFDADGKIVVSSIIKSKDSTSEAYTSQENYCLKEKIRLEQNNKIMSIHSLSLDGKIIEFKNNILAMFFDKSYNILEKEAISIRTYPNSIRYNNLVTIVTEDGLYLKSFFPSEYEINRSNNTVNYDKSYFYLHK